MAFLYPFTLKGSEWSQAQSDPQQPKEALFDLLLLIGIKTTKITTTHSVTVGIKTNNYKTLP